MAVDFLTAEQKAQYGQYACEPNEVQLSRYFHLDESDLALIANRRGDNNKLGFALQLTTVRFLGTFLPDVSLVPTNAQAFVGQQLAVKNVAVLSDYAQRETTKREHTALIRRYYGYSEFSDPHWSFRLSRVLYTRAWISNERPSLLFDFSTVWLIQHKVLLPGETTLSRLISEIRERSANRLWRRLSLLPNREQKAKLETLLQVPDGQRASEFDRFRKGPTTISGPAVNLSVQRYLDLQAFGMRGIDFSRIPPVRLKNLARHASVISMNKIARMPEDKRIAILVAFAKAYETIALDDALDVLDMLITEIARDAKNIGQKNRLRTLKDLDRSALTLAAVCALLCDEEMADDELRDAIFTQYPKKLLVESIDTVNSLARPADDRFHNELVEQYGRVRRFLPKLLTSIQFKAAPAGKATIEALSYLVDLGASRHQILDNPPLDIVSKPWKRLVFNSEDQAVKRGYTLCFLGKLQDSFVNQR